MLFMKLKRRMKRKRFEKVITILQRITYKSWEARMNTQENINIPNTSKV